MKQAFPFSIRSLNPAKQMPLFAFGTTTITSIIICI